MIINNKILSIPPYLSTQWENISALYLKDTDLVVVLNNGEKIQIPGLPQEVVNHIFTAHALSKEIEKKSSTQASPISENSPVGFMNALKNLARNGGLENEGNIIHFGLSSLDGMGGVAGFLHHDIKNANAPNLPEEILQKISMVAKIFSEEGAKITQQDAEPHCNCPYCQVARAINSVVAGDPSAAVQKNLPDHPGMPVNHEEEEVTDKDLEFQQWEVVKTGNDLYTVTNRLDTQEKYSVYLGHPVGCTCGKQGCEHVIAVLKS